MSGRGRETYTGWRLSTAVMRVIAALLLLFAPCPRHRLFGVWFDPNLELSSEPIDGLLLSYQENLWSVVMESKD